MNTSAPLEIGFITNAEMASWAGTAHELVSKKVKEYEGSLPEGFELVAHTVATDSSRDGYVIRARVVEALTDKNYAQTSMTREEYDRWLALQQLVPASSNWSGDPFQWSQGAVKYATGANSNKINVPPASSPAVDYSQHRKVSTSTLDDESKALLRNVEDRVTELLGKHPYSRMANMRKAIDELLGPDRKFEGALRVDCIDGLEGWESRWSEQKLSGVAHRKTIPMPTEMEALAELVRVLQGPS